MTKNLNSTSSLELEQQQQAIEKAESFDVETLSTRSSNSNRNSNRNSNSNSSDGDDESPSTLSSTIRRKAVVLSTTLILIIVITAVVLGVAPSYYVSCVGETSNKDTLNPTGNTTDEKQYNNSDSTTSWPELVGMPGEDAKAYLKDLDPSLRVYLVPPGGLVTQDYREDRVWVYVDEDGLVMATPAIGR
jgi:hypothetical protein